MFHQFLEWSDNSGLSQWLLSICTFAVVLLVSLIARRVIWRRLEIWARSTQSPLVATFLIELRFPVVVFLIITALGIGMQMAPAAIKAYPVVGYGSKVTFIIFSVWLLERILSAFFRSQSLPTFFAGSTKTLLLTVSRLFLLAFGLLVVLDTVGISITPILASLGVGSVAVALALQDTLGNFFSGLYILIDKPIRIGDFVKVDEGIEGHV
ncbi:MAG TPA: mechanosensitive ion channel, partial [Oligoflexia bacterium]|nr:mechanosensitive ion channel [Oligoflexia bacterium]